MFDEGGVKQRNLFENNYGFHVVTTVSYLNRVKLICPVILHMGFFEAVVETHRVRDERTSYT